MIDLDELRRYAARLRDKGSPYGAISHTGLIAMADELALARAVVEAATYLMQEREIEKDEPGDYDRVSEALTAYRALVGGTVKPAHWPISWSPCCGCDKPAEIQDRSGLKWCPACREKNHRKEVARDP